MKKLLMVAIALIASFQSFAQENEIEKQIVKVFRETYVEETYKDPYSFKLLKITAIPVTHGQWIQNDIDYMNKMLQTGEKLYEPKDEFMARKSKYETELSSMSDEKKKTLKCYEVKLDCYGNNSYGNPVLGRYKFNFFPNTDYTKEKLFVMNAK